VIESTVEPDLVIHRVEGPFGLDDISNAMSVTISVGEDAAVLWGLRKVPFEREPDEYESGVPRPITLIKHKMRGGKPAFVVAAGWQGEFLEYLIGKSTAPWPWTVFFGRR
jgi:hypothetical protein